MNMPLKLSRRRKSLQGKEGREKRSCLQETKSSGSGGEYDCKAEAERILAVGQHQKCSL